MKMPDYIVINDDLRTMQIPDSITLLGVESDDDVNKIPFQMPKEYCGFDLSTFQARINYMNANGGGDIYIVDDLEVDGDDPSLMNFTWLVGRNACAYKGNTQFIVCLKLFDANSNVIKEFNTTVYSLPVLQGLETTEAVVQQNADIIEDILKKIAAAGITDLSNYYTKSEVAQLIPTRLPNPYKLTINGNDYDGSAAVDVIIEATSEVIATVEGKIIHITDAVPMAVSALDLYDSDGDQLQSAVIAVANKNLFRLDLIGAQVISKGLTFTKNADGSITVNGTSTGTYPMTSCNLDKNIFVVGNTYTISTGKTSGYTYVQLILNYADNSTDYIVARNSARTFTISKPVASCTGSVQITDSGVTVSNETIYPMLELSDTASAFVMNTYRSMTYNGTVMPVLPDTICNLWSTSDIVDNIVLEYTADTVMTKVNDYVQKNISTNNSGISATHDGAGTVTISLGG